MYEEEMKAYSKKYELEESLKRRNERKPDPYSKSIKTIQLKSPEIPQDAFYENNEVFITFCLKDLEKYIEDPRWLKVLRKYRPTKGLQMRNFSEHASRFKDEFADFLGEGKMMVYSKTEGKLVETIKKFDFKVPSTYGRSFHLPDGTLFWEIVDIHFNTGHRWVEKK